MRDIEYFLTKDFRSDFCVHFIMLLKYINEGLKTERIESTRPLRVPSSFCASEPGTWRIILIRPRIVNFLENALSISGIFTYQQIRMQTDGYGEDNGCVLATIFFRKYETVFEDSKNSDLFNFSFTWRQLATAEITQYRSCNSRAWTILKDKEGRSRCPFHIHHYISRFKWWR